MYLFLCVSNSLKLNIFNLKSQKLQIFWGLVKGSVKSFFCAHGVFFSACHTNFPDSPVNIKMTATVRSF